MKNAITNSEIDKLRNERSNALKGIDDHINNNFGPNSDIVKGQDTSTTLHVSTIDRETLGNMSVHNESIGDADSPSPRRRRVTERNASPGPESIAARLQPRLHLPCSEAAMRTVETRI